MVPELNPEQLLHKIFVGFDLVGARKRFRRGSMNSSINISPAVTGFLLVINISTLTPLPVLQLAAQLLEVAVAQNTFSRVESRATSPCHYDHG
jgi:hypothetical protein